MRASHTDLVEPASEPCMKGADELPEIQRSIGVNDDKENCQHYRQLIRVVPPSLSVPCG